MDRQKRSTNQHDVREGFIQSLTLSVGRAHWVKEASDLGKELNELGMLRFVAAVPFESKETMGQRDTPTPSF